jgi:hypothetical protein
VIRQVGIGRGRLLGVAADDDVRVVRGEDDLPTKALEWTLAS